MMTNTENRFKHEGVWYIAVEGDGCKNCAFNINKPTRCNIDLVEDLNIGCSRFYRKDNRNVIFVESDADKGLQKKWLVESLGWDSARMSRMCNKNNAEIKSVALVANALDMKVSEFIALGE